MTTEAASTTVQVHRVYIRASPQAVWDAITTPEWNERYGYGGVSEYDLHPGGAYRALADEGMKAMGVADVIVDGEVLEADPPHKLVQTWRILMTGADPVPAATVLTYEIVATPTGLTKLTVVHDVSAAPELGPMVAGNIEGAGGGWPWILSDLKSLIETGEPIGWTG